MKIRVLKSSIWQWLVVSFTFICSLSHYAYGQDALPFDAVPADAASPFGGMSIAPKRLVLDNSNRADVVSLYNTSADIVTFRIDAIDLIPLESGGYKNPEDEQFVPDWSAKPHVRFAPRQVTLRSGEKQSIKVISQTSRNIAPGEYRTHMRFSTIPRVQDVDADEEIESEAKTVSLSFGLEYRIIIPVLLRVGELSEDLSIETASFETNSEGNQIISARLKRDGDESGFSLIRVLNRENEEIGLLKGLAIYPPLKYRDIVLGIPQKKGVPYKLRLENNATKGQGKLHSEFIFP